MGEKIRENSHSRWDNKQKQASGWEKRHQTEENKQKFSLEEQEEACWWESHPVVEIGGSGENTSSEIDFLISPIQLFISSEI